MISTLLGLSVGKAAIVYIRRVTSFLEFLGARDQLLDEQSDAEMEICPQENGDVVDDEVLDLAADPKEPPGVPILTALPSANAWLRISVSALKEGEDPAGSMSLSLSLLGIYYLQIVWVFWRHVLGQSNCSLPLPPLEFLSSTHSLEPRRT